MRIPRRIRFGAAAALVLAAACSGADAERRTAAAARDTGAAGDSAAPDAAPAAPRSARDEAPEVIRGLYLNAYAAGSPNRLPKLLKMADDTEINTFVVDVKDEKGIRYNTEVALAKELAQPGEVTIENLRAFVDTVKAHDLYLIARIVLFKDPILSRARPDWSVLQAGGALWRDKAGNSWVSPWDENVWDFNLDIAEEVARAGFDEIQFDYVRFAEPYRSLPPQVHPKARGDRTDAIAGFLNEAKRRLHPLGVTVTADVFGLSPNDPRDVNIGQQWETIASTADHILPMMYPSHYMSTHLPGVPKPDLMPYETIFKSAGMARLRNDRLRAAGLNPARVIVWLQAFDAKWLGRNHQHYGPEQLRQQKQGVYDVGFDDWVLWEPGSRYEPVLAGLEATAQSRRKADYTPPPEVLAAVDLFERQGIREAREKAAQQARGDVTDPTAAQAARSGRRP
ncbi:MAG TPA: putative glycoside hydrolase [Longimicrobiaceae bacterium]|nr:putative glycoside hydrolase [Longimicrobiaceae bacterium]